MSTVDAIQIGGSHYKGTPYQHWDFVLRALQGRYLEGNITKYLTRHRSKNGLQDLQKARHYLSKLMQECRSGTVTSMVSAEALYIGLSRFQSAEHFCDVNGVNEKEREIIIKLSRWSCLADLGGCALLLDELISEHEAREEQAAEVTSHYINQDWER